jgi:PAS domain S-box-containing protein
MLPETPTTSGSGTQRRLVPAFVGALALAAVASTAVVAISQGADFVPHWPYALVVLGLMVQSQFMRVRYHYRGQTDDLNFFEATLAIAFVAFPAAEAALLAAAATGVAVAMQRIPPVKSVFNIAQWTLAAAAGGSVYAALHSSSPTTDLFALLVAVLTALLINQAALAAVLYLTTGHPLGAEYGGLARRVLVGRCISVLGATSLGLLLASAYQNAPWVILTAFIPVALLHWASRGHATARTDQERLTGLQRATHALSVSLDLPEAMQRFLDETKRSFDVRGVELLVLQDGQWHSFAAGAVASADEETRTARLRAVQRSVRQTTRLSLDRTESRVMSDYMTAHGAGDCVVTPLSGDDRQYGVLCLVDRIGNEGFEDGELTVVGALAAELVGYLERGALVGQLLDEQTKMARIVEQTSDGIVTLSPDGVIRTWNAAFEAVTGYRGSEMIGTKHFGVLRARDESGADVWLEKWTTLERLPERIQVRTSAGEMRWLSCSFTRVSGTDEGESTLIVVGRDVTAAHELERLKDDFVAVVSHELRTPLVPIKGWASMLLARGERMTPEQRRDALESIQAQALRLERLVLNILDASRIEGGLESSSSLVDVSNVASRVVDEMLPSSATHILRLHGASRPLMAFGQSVWLERALANLVANAVKYSPAETTVEMTLSQEGADIVVRVTDEGPGIPSGWAERIFERFERVPESNTQTGTGLGLYITRQLVSTMGGRVEVEHSTPGGTVFCLRLRAATVHVPHPRQNEPAPEQTADTLI